MANTYKSPEQLKPVITTLEDLYTVPADTQAIVSNFHVCNLGVTDATVRIAVRKGGAAIADEHYVFNDITIAGKDTVQLGDGITLGATDVVSVYSSSGEVVFNMSYVEVT